MIYFITCGEYVKIGVAKNPQERLIGLQTGNPSQLHLAAVIPGGYEVESAYHNLLDDIRVRGEWFKIDKRVSAMIRLFNSLFGVDGTDAPDIKDRRIKQLEDRILELSGCREDYSPMEWQVSESTKVHFVTLYRIGGEFTKETAVSALGLSKKGTGNVLKSALAHGVLEKVRRGIYVPNGVDPRTL